MNVSLNGNVNYSGVRGGGGNNSGGATTSGSNSGNSNTRAGDIRQRYGHHHGAGGDVAFGGGMVGQTAAAAAAIGDYSGLTNQQYGRAGLAGHFNPSGPGGMNAMNPASLYPHLGSAVSAGLAHPSQQQPAASAMGDYSGGAGSSSQAEQEEELLLNILIARRQRQQVGPGAGGGGQPSNSTSWADDFMRLREKTMNSQQHQQQDPTMGSAVGERMSFDSMGNPLHQGDSSHRASSHGRMSIAGGPGMGHNVMQTANSNSMNMNMNMNMAPQFLAADSSRLRHSMGFQIGSPQGAWMGANAASVHAHHQHQQNPCRNDNAYAHGQRQDMSVNMSMNMKSNTQLGMDVLERVDRMVPANMIHDARMADHGGGAGQHLYHQHAAMGQRHGMGMQDPPAMLYGKRSLDGQSPRTMGKPAVGKAIQQPPQQMQHLFASPPKEEETEPAKKKRLHKRKPADMPRRPLSAYNLFFSEERERILKEIEGGVDEEDDDGDVDNEGGPKDNKDDSKPKALLRPLLPSEKKRRPHRKTHGKISFQLLAQRVGQRWKALPDDRRRYYQDLAQEDMKRQKKAMEEYYQKRSGLTAIDSSKETQSG
jgi:HMG (high mobility group) box